MNEQQELLDYTLLQMNSDGCNVNENSIERVIAEHDMHIEAQKVDWFGSILSQDSYNIPARWYKGKRH